MFLHFVRVEHLAHLERDRGGAAQRIALAPDSGLDAREVLLGRRQQLFAFAGAFGGEVGIAADDQPLAGEVGRGDAGHVALVEQRQLQGAAGQQLLDGWGA